MVGAEAGRLGSERVHRVAETERSLAHMSEGDLRRLGELAAAAEAALFARHPDGAGRYAGRLLCRALCQGAALHFVDGRHEVKDFDVWSFYAARGDGPFPYRWRGTADFGPSKFGRWHGDPPSYAGRRVDFLGRSLPYCPARTRLRYYATTCHHLGPPQRRHCPTRPPS
jgi:hypothetical protein